MTYEEYRNARVKEIEKKLGRFDYSLARPSSPRVDNEPLEERDVMMIDNNSKYKGQWSTRTGLRHGRGVQVWPDGSIYEGYWKHDKAEGRGRLIHSDGDVYEGEWKEDKANG